jgi:hypothetical protein
MVPSWAGVPAVLVRPYKPASTTLTCPSSCLLVHFAVLFIITHPSLLANLLKMAPQFSPLQLQKAIVRGRANAGPSKKKRVKVSKLQIICLRKYGDPIERIMAEVSFRRQAVADIVLVQHCRERTAKKVFGRGPGVCHISIIVSIRCNKVDIATDSAMSWAGL